MNGEMGINYDSITDEYGLSRVLPEERRREQRLWMGKVVARLAGPTELIRIG